VVVGLKKTLILQTAPALSTPELPGQLLNCTKSALLVPDTAMLEMVNETVPVFVIMRGCAGLMTLAAWLPKARLVAETVTDGVGTVIVMAAEPDFVVSSVLVAVTVTEFAAGTAAGAM
jgi:hypothetical protein